MFENLQDRFNSALRNISGRGKITESNVSEALDEVRAALLEADVHYEVASQFVDGCREKALGEKVLESIKPGQLMIKIVHDELVDLMRGRIQGAEGDEETEEPGDPLMYISPGPTIVMMSGLQGSGKTTTCGKLAAYLKKKGKRVMLCAADLQRPAAVRQLEVLSQQVGSEDVPGDGQVMFYAEPDKCAEYGKAVGVAVKVCQNAFKAAQQQKCDVLVLDTAGRLHINDDLMGELKRIERALTPQHIFLVIDVMTGQDAVNSAKAFNEQLELDGVILTKFDSDTRGGAALTVKHVTGKPIKFLGIGEKIDALEEFHPERVAGRILGMGDVVSLVEKAQEQVSEEEALALQEKMAKGKLTMDDFLSQLRSIQKMGSMKSLMGMLPGVGSQIKDLDIDDRQIKRTEAMIQSMTADERRDVNLLNNSRRRRISKGSGTSAQDISQLVKGFNMVSSLTKQMSGLGMMQRMKAMMGGGGKDMAAALMGAGGMPNTKGSTKQKRSKFKKRKRR